VTIPSAAGLFGSSVAADILRADDPPLTVNFLIMMADTSGTGSTLTTGALSLVGDVFFGGFTECTGLEVSQTDVKQSVGGRNDAQLRFPSSLVWTNLVLKNGISRINQTGWDWLYSFGQGRVRRMNGIIALLDSLHLPHTIWSFKNAFPVRYTGPSFNSTANTVAVEALELAHEGLWQVPTSPSAAVF
jgi:phage tail-like protein